MRRFGKKGAYSSIAMLLLGLVITVPAYAKSTSQKISEVQQQMEQTESEMGEVKDQISGLEDTKNDLQGELGSLKAQLSNIVAELEKLEKQLKQKEEEIELTRQELEEAKKTEAEQYEAMKVRIRFMYERNDLDYLKVLLGSGNFSDVLNQLEYVSKITQYDRDMLVKYQETKAQVEQKEADLLAEQEALISLQEETNQKQQEVSTLASKKSSEIADYNNQISEAEQKALAYEQRLREQENSLENLKRIEEEERLAAERAKAANATNNTSGIPFGSPTAEALAASDLDLLAAIIECEADGESYEGKIAVGNVVLNRVKSKRYADSVVQVLFQRYQFTPVTSGRFSLVLARGANSRCRAAAQDVLNGNVVVGPEILHFRTVNGYTQGIVIGNHVFY